MVHLALRHLLNLTGRICSFYSIDYLLISPCPCYSITILLLFYRLTIQQIIIFKLNCTVLLFPVFLYIVFEKSLTCCIMKCHSTAIQEFNGSIALYCHVKFH